MKRMSRGAERARQEPSPGLLGERWTREPSNRPSEARHASKRRKVENENPLMIVKL